MHFSCETHSLSCPESIPGSHLLPATLHSPQAPPPPAPWGGGVSQWSPPNHKFRNEFRKALCMTGQVSDGNKRGPDVGARGGAEVGCTESPDTGKRQRGLPKQANSSHSPV